MLTNCEACARLTEAGLWRGRQDHQVPHPLLSQREGHPLSQLQANLRAKRRSLQGMLFPSPPPGDVDFEGQNSHHIAATSCEVEAATLLLYCSVIFQGTLSRALISCPPRLFNHAVRSD